MTTTRATREQLRRALDGISGILVTPFDADDRLAPAADERLQALLRGGALPR